MEMAPRARRAKQLGGVDDVESRRVTLLPVNSTSQSYTQVSQHLQKVVAKLSHGVWRRSCCYRPASFPPG